MEPADKTNFIHFLVTEYWKLKDEQCSRIEYRDHMTYLTLGAIGAVFSFAIEKPDYAVSLLVLPFICIVLGWTYLMNDEKTSSIDAYIRSELIPKIKNTVSEGKDAPFKNWEEFHLQISRRMERKWIQLFIDLALFCLSALLSVGAFFAIAKNIAAIHIIIAVVEGILIVLLGNQFFSYSPVKEK